MTLKPQSSCVTKHDSIYIYTGCGRLQVVRAVYLLEVGQEVRFPGRAGGTQGFAIRDGATSDLFTQQLSIDCAKGSGRLHTKHQEETRRHKQDKSTAGINQHTIILLIETGLITPKPGGGGGGTKTKSEHTTWEKYIPSPLCYGGVYKIFAPVLPMHSYDIYICLGCLFLAVVPSGKCIKKKKKKVQ